MRHDPFDADFDPDLDDDGNEGPVHGLGFQTGERFPPFSSHEPHEPEPCCPRCLSRQIEPCHRARRIAAVLGTLAGATSGIVRVLQAAELVSTGVGVAVGGPVIGTLASAMVTALLEGTAGCSLGVKFGDAIDRAIVPRCHCLSCGHTFSTSINPAS